MAYDLAESLLQLLSFHPILLAKSGTFFSSFLKQVSINRQSRDTTQ